MAPTKKTTVKRPSSKVEASEGQKKKEQITELVKKLELATVQREKKSIRRSLRALGHYGGLKKAKA